MAQLRRKGQVLTEKHLNGSEMRDLGKAADEIHKAKFASLSLRQAIRDDAFSRTVQKKLALKMPPGASLLDSAIRAHRGRAIASAAKPKGRRAPGPPIPEQQPKRRGLAQPWERAAKALKEQDQNTGESAVVAEAPPTAMAAAARHALRAHAGEKHATQTGSQKVEVKKTGETEWVEYASKSDADKKLPFLKAGSISKFLAGKAPKKAAEKYEVRLVSKDVPISELTAYAAFGSAIGLRHDIKHAPDLNAYLAELVPRVVLPLSDKEAPKTWKSLLEHVVELPEFDQGILYEQTRHAEDERVLALQRSILGGGRDALRESRRLAADADAVANDEADAAWIADAVFDKEGLLIGCTAQERDVRVSFLESWAPSWDDERVMVGYKGGQSQLKGGPWTRRVGWGFGGRSGLSVAPLRASVGEVGKEVALLLRETASHAIAMTQDAACGAFGLGHAGRGGLCTLIASPRQHPLHYIRQLDFDPYVPLRAMGLVRRDATPATRHDGSSLEGWAIEEYELRVPGQTWTMDDVEAESLRLRPLVLATTPEDRRIAGSKVKVSYRRGARSADMPNTVSLVLCVPNRARGPTDRTIGVVAMLEAMGFPIYAWLTRRAIENCVPLEFIAYRDPTKGGSYHFDTARNLLLSTLMMKSVTMKEAAKIDPLHSAAMLKGN